MSEGPRDPSGVRQPAGGPVSERSSPGPQTVSQRACPTVAFVDSYRNSAVRAAEVPNISMIFNVGYRKIF